MNFNVPTLLLGAAILFGCTTGTPIIDETRHVSSGDLKQGEKITLVGLEGVTNDILSCVDEALRDKMPGLELVPAVEFRDTMFPWFEPNRAPTDTDTLYNLLRRKVVKRRLESLRLRYVVVIEGSVRSTSESWGGVVAGGAPMGFVLGGVEMDESTRLSASILDLQSVRNVAEFEANTKGSSRMGVIILIPYFGITETMTPTCHAIASRVAGFIGGDVSEE